MRARPPYVVACTSSRKEDNADEDHADEEGRDDSARTARRARPRCPADRSRAGGRDGRGGDDHHLDVAVPGLRRRAAPGGEVRGQHRKQRRLAVPREGEGGHPAGHRRVARRVSDRPARPVGRRRLHPADPDRVDSREHAALHGADGRAPARLAAEPQPGQPGRDDAHQRLPGERQRHPDLDLVPGRPGREPRHGPARLPRRQGPIRHLGRRVLLRHRPAAELVRGSAGRIPRR